MTKEKNNKEMRKDIIVGVVCTIFGGAITMGFDVLRMKLFPPDSVISKGITELSHFNQELLLEQKALNQRIGQLAEKASNNPDIQIELGDIINRVNNIVHTSAQFEAKSRDVSSLADTVSRSNVSSKYNANADAVLSDGQGISVCGNENVLSVNQQGSTTWVSLNGKKDSAISGDEYLFDSPQGSSMVGYLGQTSGRYEFRIVCGTKTKK